MDWQIAIPVLSLLVAIYAAVLQRRQVQLMVAAKQNKRTVISTWWKSPVVIACAILALAAWGPTLSNLFQPKPLKIGVSSWGADISNQILPIAAVVAEQTDDIHLMGIAFHYDGQTDWQDASHLQKSALYDARVGVVEIIIKPDDQFIQEVASHQHVRTNYLLLSFPSKIEHPQFSTVRQAFSLGAKLIWSGTGPP